jgi:hypothetical protein
MGAMIELAGAFLEKALDEGIPLHVLPHRTAAREHAHRLRRGSRPVSGVPDQQTEAASAPSA